MNSLQYFDPHETEDKVRIIIIEARWAKKEVGKRSKSMKHDKTKTKNGKTGTWNLNKLPK